MIRGTFPDKFTERLKRIIPPALYDGVLEKLCSAGPLTARVNTLRIPLEEAGQMLRDRGIVFDGHPDVPEAVCFGADPSGEIAALEFFERGEFYRQSLSSMLAVAALDPAPEERVLDLCAAPGSKTSQIAARMRNTGTLTAVEAVRGRFYKLKSVLRLLGVENASCLCMDGRRFRAGAELFDRVLVDAPCSSEGMFRLDRLETFAYWSARKIREMVKKQRGLLLNGSRQVAPGGILVYSTCTFAPEENEGVVDWFLRKNTEFIPEPVGFSGVPVYPALSSWEEKAYDPRVEQCVRVLPGLRTDGFFIGKFRRQ